MATRIGGSRRKSRHKLTKNVRDKGKLSLRRFFQSFEEGEKVVLNAEPSYQKGMYHLRHHGRMGKIMGMNGNCYKVQIKDINKIKNLVVHPVHLKKI